MIKKNLVKKCLEMLAEIAELRDDYVESDEQLGKSLRLGVHENSTVRAKDAELLRLNDSAPEDEQLDLEGYVDRMKGELNDKTTDVPVVSQSQVPIIQPVQKTVEVPQVQFLDRMVEQITETPAVSLAEETVETPKTQTQEKIICCSKENQSEFSEERQGCTVEKADVLVSHTMEKIIEVSKPIPQERGQNSTVEQTVDVPVPQIQEETVEVPQIQFIDRAVDVPVVMQRLVPTVQKVQRTVEVLQAHSIDKVVYHAPGN